MNWDSVRYFNRNEFECKCGCGLMCIDYELVKKLDFAREVAGVPFVINSACRCFEHNKEIGGLVNSSHLRGYAVDIAVSNSKDRFRILVALLSSGFNRFGVYRDFIHCDIDLDKPQNVIWYK